MPHVADNPEQYLGKHHGESEHCVALVKHAAGLGATPSWRRGDLVRGSGAPKGTIIATFSAGGRYENRTDGASHAAILIGEEDVGLAVIDQWMDHPTARRIIRYKDGVGPAMNDGDRYYLVETA
jgi:hypothetical protein